MEGFRAYLTAEGRLAATQETAGKGFTQVTVPYKKGELIEFINGMLGEATSWKEVEQEGVTGVPGVPLTPGVPGADGVDHLPRTGQGQAFAGESIYHSIAQGREPGVDVVCGRIFTADPVTLSRYATSVSMAYDCLSKGVKR